MKGCHWHTRMLDHASCTPQLYYHETTVCVHMHVYVFVCACVCALCSKQAYFMSHGSIIILQQHGLFKARQSRNPYTIGTAERKLLIVFVYYVVLTVVALTAFTLIVQDAEKLISARLLYFQCESKGIDPDNPCDPNIHIKLDHVALTSLSYILLGLFPVVNFVFVISVRDLKETLRKRCPCLFNNTISRI